MSLIIHKNIKKIFQENGLKTSTKALNALEIEFHKICLKSMDNAKADGIKIVQAGHIPHLDALLDSSPFKNFASMRAEEVYDPEQEQKKKPFASAPSPKDSQPTSKTSSTQTSK